MCLAWCAFAGWWAFGRDERIPLLAFVNLGFHELGHLICYLVPVVGTVVTASAGSVMQCLVPIAIAGYFLVWRRDRLAAAACLAWAATNLQEAAVYIADAPFEELQLIGGEHDWATVLGPEHLNRLHDAGSIAGTVRGIGVVVLVAAVFLCIVTLATSGSGSANRRDPRQSAEVDERFLV
ncbi:MAG: hypothetical protein ACXW2Y_07080 [Acidimicrobiia bacterium]